MKKDNSSSDPVQIACFSIRHTFPNRADAAIAHRKILPLPPGICTIFPLIDDLILLIVKK